MQCPEFVESRDQILPGPSLAQLLYQKALGSRLVIIMSGFNPEMRQGLEEEKQADRELGKIQGVRNRGYTEDKKNLLKELDIFLNKGDGPFSKSVFEKLKVTVNRKGKVNGAEFDNVRIIVQKGKKLVYTEDVKKLAKVTEF